MKFDPWQEEVLATEGNICLRSGRQVGKSTVIGAKAAKFALENDKKLIMVISKTERQAGLLFAKILYNISLIDRKQIARGKGVGQNPTKHKIVLKNGSVIHCLPAGDTGFGIMGFTIDLLIADEAAFIPEEVWNSIIPALAITRGAIWLLSTPFLKEGFYYDCFKEDSGFETFHTSSEDCPRKDQEFLDRRKRELTRAQYAQMYLGEFVDDLHRVYTKEWIEKVCTLERRPIIIPNREYYSGHDVGRKKDEFVHAVTEKISEKYMEQVENLIEEQGTSIPVSTRHIIDLDKKYDLIKINVDSGGMGITVCDILREDDDCKMKVVEVDNASRPIDAEEGRTKKILKEDLHNNLVRLGEQGMIKLLNDDEIKESLKTVLKDYNERGRLIIDGSDTHIAEAIIRAVLPMKTKHLKPFIIGF